MIFKTGCSLEIQKVSSNISTLLQDTNNKVAGDLKITDTGDFLYFVARAMTADVPNSNGDMFPTDELKKSYGTFVGRGLHLNHQNTNRAECAVGKIIESWFVEKENDNHVLCLCKVDRKLEPLIARKIESGVIDAVSMGCFQAGTPILMADGKYIPIEDIVPGDIVIDHKNEKNMVSKTFKREYVEDIYKITFSSLQNLSLIATNEHPFWIIGKQDIIINSNPNNPIEKNASADINKFKWVNSKDLQLDDYVAFPFPTKIETPDYVDRDFARFLGYYLSEGCIGKDIRVATGNIKTPTNLQFSFHFKEKTYANEVATIFKKLTGKDANIHYHEKSKSCNVICYDQDLTNKVLYLCGQYSKEKSLDESVWYWDPNLQLELIGTFLNGDGFYTSSQPNKYGNVISQAYLETASYNLINQLEWMLLRNNIIPTLEKKYYKPTDHDFEDGRGIQHIIESTTYRLCINRGGLNKLKNVTDKIPHDIIFPEFNHFNQRKFILNNYLMTPIIGIEVLPYNNYVYNLEVENNNSYIAGGIAVHNCQASESECSICHKIMTSSDDFCEHMDFLGRTIEINGQATPVVSINRGLTFTELSLVGNPADETAKMKAIYANADEEKKSMIKKLASDMNVELEKSDDNKQVNLTYTKEGDVFRVTITENEFKEFATEEEAKAFISNATANVVLDDKPAVEAAITSVADEIVKVDEPKADVVVEAPVAEIPVEVQNAVTDIKEDITKADEALATGDIETAKEIIKDVKEDATDLDLKIEELVIGDLVNIDDMEGDFAITEIYEDDGEKFVAALVQDKSRVFKASKVKKAVKIVITEPAVPAVVEASVEVKAEDIPTKPTSQPPSGQKYVYNAQSKVWELHPVSDTATVEVKTSAYKATLLKNATNPRWLVTNEDNKIVAKFYLKDLPKEASHINYASTLIKKAVSNTEDEHLRMGFRFEVSSKDIPLNMSIELPIIDGVNAYIENQPSKEKVFIFSKGEATDAIEAYLYDQKIKYKLFDNSTDKKVDMTKFPPTVTASVEKTALQVGDKYTLQNEDNTVSDINIDNIVINELTNDTIIKTTIGGVENIFTMSKFMGLVEDGKIIKAEVPTTSVAPVEEVKEPVVEPVVEAPVEKEASTYKEASIKGWTLVDRDEANMSGYLGAFEMPYRDVVKKFGQPNSTGDSYKVDAEWVFATPAGILTIYNYKTGPNYDENVKSIDDVNDWHIGGFDKSVLHEFKKATGLTVTASKVGKQAESFDWNEITEEDFNEYVNCQMSGATNMFDIATVEEITGLSKDQCIAIMKHYSELDKKYPNVKKQASTKKQASAFDKVEKIDIAEGLFATKNKETMNIEVKDLDGKVICELSDAFGDEIVPIVKVINDYVTMKNACDNVNNTLATEKEAAIKEIELQKTASQKYQLELTAANNKIASIQATAELNKKASVCNEIIKVAFDKGLLAMDETAYDKAIKAGKSPIEAKEEAIKASVNKQIKSLMAMDDKQIEAYTNTVKTFKPLIMSERVAGKFTLTRGFTASADLSKSDDSVTILSDTLKGNWSRSR